MKYLKAVGQFWYEFIIGDDWKIAASVISALTLTLALYKAGVPEHVVTVIGGVLILAAFTVSLAIDIHTATDDTDTSDHSTTPRVTPDSPTSIPAAPVETDPPHDTAT